MGVRKPIITLFSLVLTVYYLRYADLASTGTGVNLLRDLQASQNPDVVQICGDVDPENIVSQKERDRADGFRKSLTKIRGGESLKKYIDGGDDYNDYFKDYLIKLIPYTAVWIVFFIFSIIGACVYACNWCCMYACCKNCCKKKCQCCKVPKTKKCYMFYFVGAKLFTTAIIGASIAGLVLSSNVGSSTQKTTCAVATAMGDLLEGTSATTLDGEPIAAWLGVKKAIERIDEILADLNTIINNLDTLTYSENDFDTKKDAVIAQLNGMITVYGSTTVDRADASQGTYKPEYIKNLGPINDDDSYTGMIRKEVETKNDVVKQAASSIKESVDYITDDSNDIQSSIQSGRDAADEIRAALDDFLSSLSDSSDTVNSVGDKLGLGLMIVFVVNLVVSVLSIGSIMLVKFCKMKFFSKITHVTCCLMSIFMILGFLVSAVTFPVSIVLMESCEVLDAALSESTYLHTALGSFNVESDAIDIVDTCFFKDGELLEQLGVKEELTKFDTIFDELEKAKEGNVFTETGNLPRSFVIPIQMDYVEGVRDGKYLDSEETAIDLAKLNGLTHKGCTSINDLWVINSINCTITKFVNGDGVNGKKGNNVCIGLDEWGNLDISVRYSGLASCQTEATSAIPIVQGFMAHRDEIEDLFNGIATDTTNSLKSVNEKNEEYMNLVEDMNDKFQKVNTDLKTIQSAFTDPDTGIVNNANCKFLKVSLKRLTDTMCVSFVSSLYQTTICILIVSFCSFFGSFFVFCLAKRLNVKDQKDDEEEQYAKNGK